MARRATGRLPHVVGLDIGTSGVRAVEVRGRRNPRVVRAASVPLAPGVVANGRVLDPKALSVALRRLWRRGRFGTRRVCLALSDVLVITRRVELPWMPLDDFRSALRYQVADALPVDLSEVELDFHPLREFAVPDSHGQDLDMLEILLVATNSAVVTTLCDALIAARLNPVITDTGAFCLMRAVEERGLEALIDVGADVASIVIHEAGQPKFIRAVPNHGAGSAVEAIVNGLGLPPAEAEALLRAAGLNGPAPIVTSIAESSVFGLLDSAPEATVDLRTRRALEVINPWAAGLVGAIRDSLDYYAASPGGSRVTSIRLTGRASRIDGLAERLRTELRCTVAMLPAFGDLATKPRLRVGDDESYAVAAGAAVTAMGG